MLFRSALGDFSSADFPNASKTIPIGERAAHAVADRLSALSISEDEYRRYLERLRPARDRLRFEQVRVDTRGLTRANPDVVEATFADASRGESSEAAISKGIAALLATDDFQQVQVHVDREAGAPVLTVEPREKSWGPNYMRFGLGMSTDFDGESAFTLLGDHRMTWLNSRGLEWRNRIALGDQTGIVSELYQPLDLPRKWFVAPGASALQQLDTIFMNRDRKSVV